MLLRSRVLAVALALCSLSAVAASPVDGGAPAAAAPGRPLQVFAAVSLAPALEELGAAFRAQPGGAEVRFAFGASSDLARQLVAGARADVFFSADVPSLEKVEAAKRSSAEDRTPLLSNRLVVAARSDSTLKVGGAKDLVGLKRLILADPKAVPLGVYSRQWLEKAGVWSAIEPVVVPTLDARAALAAVESGAAPAGVLYQTDAARSSLVKVLFAVPEAEGPKIVYPVAALQGDQLATAKRFVAFLRTDAARTIFERYGFVVLR